VNPGAIAHFTSINGAGSLNVAGTADATAVRVGNLAVSGKLSIKPQSLPRNSSATVSMVDSFTLDGGQFDLSNNDLVIHHGDVTAIRNAIRTGWNYNSGYWNGSGLTSSSAAGDTRFSTGLGYLQNSDGNGKPLYGTNGVFGNTFDGQTTTADDLLVKYTYYGDADLNGKVDGTDYSLLDGGFNNHLTGWLNGDFNYDGVIDGTDYSFMDGGFNNQGIALSSTEIAQPGAEVISVPEPALVPTMIVLAYITQLHRRKRSS